jgi:hypothetical protein
MIFVMKTFCLLFSADFIDKLFKALTISPLREKQIKATLHPFTVFSVA